MSRTANNDGIVGPRGETQRPKVGTRRPRGSGALSQLKDGRWQVRHWVGDKRLRRTTRTQAEALLALDEMKRKAAMGLPVGRYTVSEALDDFMHHGQAARGWAPRTVRAYSSAIEVHLRPALGKRQLGDLGVRDVSQMIETLLARSVSGRHVAHIRGVLRAAIAHAMRQELIHRNVAALAASPPVRRPEMRALSDLETRALFAALERERLRPLVITAATLGLRLGELVALRWSDLDLDSASLTVRRTGTRIRGVYIEGQPKSSRSRRSVSLPPAIVLMLKRHRAAMAVERLRLGEAWLDEDRLFPGEGGGPIGETTVRKSLDRALQKAGLPHVRVHDLRHTAATALLAAGGSLRDAQEMLGHSSYALTADLYAHVLEDQRKATADRIEKALGAAITGA